MWKLYLDDQADFPETGRVTPKGFTTARSSFEAKTITEAKGCVHLR